MQERAFVLAEGQEPSIWVCWAEGEPCGPQNPHEVGCTWKSRVDEVAGAISVHDEIEEAWKRQAEAMGMTVENVKAVAAVMAGIQSFARQEREPTVILLPIGWCKGESYMNLHGIPVRYTDGVSKPTLGFELET